MGVTRLRGSSQLKADSVTTGNIQDGSLKSEDINIAGGITAGGNTFNSADELVKLLSDGKLPVLDGSNLTSLAVGTGDLRADGTVPLTANWNVGAFDITANAFVGDGSGLTGLVVGDFNDGGEAGGANRTLGNTDEFSLGLVTNSLERMNISSSGLVGIGGTAGVTLEVFGRVRETHAGSTFFTMDKTGVSARQWNFNIDGGKDFVIRDETAGTNPFEIEEGAPTASFHVLGNGNVGLGTAAPSQALEVIGQIVLSDQLTVGNGLVSTRIDIGALASSGCSIIRSGNQNMILATGNGTTRDPRIQLQGHRISLGGPESGGVSFGASDVAVSIKGRSTGTNYALKIMDGAQNISTEAGGIGTAPLVFGVQDNGLTTIKNVSITGTLTVGGSPGTSGSFTAQSGETVTVTNGVITSIV